MMFVVLGAAGNVGSVVVNILAERGHPVLALVHNPEKRDALKRPGVEPLAFDVRDVDGLRAVFQRGKRAFLLNPPGDPTGDSEAAELETGRSIIAALDGSALEKVVLASTYGAQAGQALGDLSTLWAFEQGALASAIPAAINRGAYYFSNLDMLVDSVRDGILPTAFPADFILPMVAAQDVGHAAVERLLSGVDDIGIRNVEGPERYSFAQVASILGRLLGRDVSVATTPPADWEASFRQVGFSEKSARSFARMTSATLEGEMPHDVWRGRVGLEDYLRTLVAETSASKGRQTPPG